jgi:hypothetical protein
MIRATLQKTLKLSIDLVGAEKGRRFSGIFCLKKSRMFPVGILRHFCTRRFRFSLILMTFLSCRDITSR